MSPSRQTEARLAQLDAMLAKVIDLDPTGVEAEVAAIVARRCSGAEQPHIMQWLGELLAKPDEGPQWLVYRLIPRDGCCVLGGEPKHRKSFLVIDLALAVASGQPFLNHVVLNPGPVAVISTEDGRQRLVRRLNQLARGRNLALTSLPLLLAPRPRDFSLDNPIAMASLEAELARVSPRLLILDCWRDLFAGDENAADVVSAAWGSVRSLATALNCAVVVVCHFGKSGSDKRGGQKIRGSSALHGKLDAGIYLVGDGQDAEVVRAEFECRDQDGDEVAPMYLRLADWQDPNNQRASIWQFSQSHPKMLDKIADAIRRCKQEKGHAPTLTDLRKVGGLQAQYKGEHLADIVTQLVLSGRLVEDMQGGKARRFDVAQAGQVLSGAAAANPSQNIDFVQQSVTGVLLPQTHPTPLPGGGGGFPLLGGTTSPPLATGTVQQLHAPLTFT